MCIGLAPYAYFIRVKVEEKPQRIAIEEISAIIERHVYSFPSSLSF